MQTLSYGFPAQSWAKLGSKSPAEVIASAPQGAKLVYKPLAFSAGVCTLCALLALKMQPMVCRVATKLSAAPGTWLPTFARAGKAVIQGILVATFKGTKQELAVHDTTGLQSGMELLCGRMELHPGVLELLQLSRRCMEIGTAERGGQLLALLETAIDLFQEGSILVAQCRF